MSLVFIYACSISFLVCSEQQPIQVPGCYQAHEAVYEWVATNPDYLLQTWYCTESNPA